MPIYYIKQIENKEKHTLEVLKALKKNITDYKELPATKRSEISIKIVEELLAHLDTEVHTNVIGQS